MNKKRPINLDLSSLKYPPMAIASILHRISGVVLFLLLPSMLYLFSQSMHSEDAFIHVKNLLAHSAYKMMVWAFAAAMMYHLLAGIRHLLMDMGFGESLNAARCSAVFVIILAIIVSLFLGIWIW